MSSEIGIVFNVQRYTIHDGPGLRTELFLKGCPLRCRWCSNPEGLLRQPQVGVYRTKCIGRRACGSCVEACPQGDIFHFTVGKLAGIDRTRLHRLPAMPGCLPFRRSQTVGARHDGRGMHGGHPAGQGLL